MPAAPGNQQKAIMQPTKILHLIPTLTSGGAERQLVNNICNTSPNAFLHCVCTFGKTDFFAPMITQAGHQVRELNVSGKHPWFSAVGKILPVIGEYKPDIIQTWLYDASIVGRLAHLFHRKIPFVDTLQSTNYEPETIKAGNWSPTKVEGLRRIDKLTMRLAETQFVACSHYVKKSYQKRMGVSDSQITVIYNSVDPEMLKSGEGEPQRIRQELKISAGGFVYITVGRLDAAKNHLFLLRAFPKVLANVPQAYLIIVGTGSLEQELKDSANSLGISDRVRFLGRRADVGACLEMADVFVFPTLFEGFGLVLAEAIFKRLPCIASRLEVLQEIITENETGLLFDPTVQSQLAEAMIKIYNQPELRRQFSELALRDAEKRFHIRATIPKWENLYHQLINEKR